MNTRTVTENRSVFHSRIIIHKEVFIIYLYYIIIFILLIYYFGKKNQELIQCPKMTLQISLNNNGEGT